MSLFSTLQTAVSGLAAQSNKLGTIGDNIANSSTTGYKNADTEFETLLGNEATSSYQSGGIQTKVRYSVVDQGEITSTTSVTDLAIKGNGFFVAQTSGGANVLTRAGSFVPDENGNLVNAAGDTLMGYNLTDGSYDAATGSGTLKPVNVSTQSLSATASTSGTLSVNLPAAATASTNPPSGGSASPSYTDKTSLVAYDNLGAPVTLDVYMTKTGDNTWEADVYNAADAASGGGFPYSAGPMTTQDLTFDPTTGSLSSGSATSLSVPIPNGNTVGIDVSKTTQLAAAYTVNAGTVNGNAPSTVSNVTISTNGTVSAVYSSGVTNPTFKIPLASVESPDNLTEISGNNYDVSPNSGQMTIGSANSGSLGEIDSSSLESSTVDLASELTSMIATQNAYQANSKVLTTASTMLDTLIQSIVNT